MTPVTLSYALAAFSYLVLAVLVLTRWRGRFDGRFLPMVVVASALWTGWLAVASLRPDLGPTRAVAFFDSARTLLWITLLWRLVSRRETDAISSAASPTVRHLFVGAVVIGLGVHAVAWFAEVVIGRPISLVMLQISTGFGLALVALIFVEQLYRNSASDVRWTIKFFCLAVGGIFAYDIYVFASGLLFNVLDEDLWAARGAVNALAVPLIAMSVARSGRLKRRQFVSRRVVFYTSALLGVGTYLIVMAAGALAVRSFGGTWGAFAQILFLTGALFVLAIVLFSGQARARTKVFLTKHFLDFRYDYREEWLKLTRALTDSDDETPLSAKSLQAVAGLLDSPGGALWLQDEQAYTVQHVWNLGILMDSEVPAGSPFLQFLNDREWIIDLGQLRDDPAHYDDLDLPAWLASIDDAWIVVPLKQSDALLGFMVLARALAPRQLTFEDHDLLKTVGRQIAGHLALDRSVQLLTETRQFQAYNRLTAFIMHDLKNLIAQQSLVVKNAVRHKDKPEFIDDAIATVDNSVKRMTGLLEQLRTGESQRGARTSRVGQVCRDVVERNAQRKPVPELIVEAEGLSVDAPSETMSMVLGHLVRNAQDATPPEGSVTLIVGRDADHAIISIRDTGSGMSPEFIRERLFRPFDTTKGTKGMGIGVYQARDFMRSMGGRLTVSSVPDEGSTFVAILPLSERSRSAQAAAPEPATEEDL